MENSDIDTTVDIKCSVCKFVSCICQPFWKDFDKLLNETQFIGDGEEVVEEQRYEVSPIVISTITVNYEIDACVELETFVEICNKLKKIKEVKYAKSGRKSKSESVNYNFYNQCELHLNSDPISVLEKDKKSYNFRMTDKIPKIKISVFRNGSIKIVGCRFLSQIRKTIKFLHKLFIKYPSVLHHNKSLKIDGKNVIQKGFKKRGEKVVIKNTRMSLINCTFYVKHKINREGLANYLNNCEDVRIKSVLFDTENHEAVRVKFLSRGLHNTRKTITRKKTEKQEGEYTIMIFNTGPVIITGSQSIYDIVKGYEYINNLLYTHPELRA
jgi:TATA-box binding protein (TBP) (component of TFIID and TFIIIB)